MMDEGLLQIIAKKDTEIERLRADLASARLTLDQVATEEEAIRAELSETKRERDKLLDQSLRDYFQSQRVIARLRDALRDALAVDTKKEAAP